MIINVVLQLIKQKLPKFVDATPYDIQVLTPMRKGLLGVERLNGILQRYMNPPANDKVEKEYGSTVFREGIKLCRQRITTSSRGKSVQNLDSLWIKALEFQWRYGNHKTDQ